VTEKRKQVRKEKQLASFASFSRLNLQSSSNGNAN
jgi:hypothetical protein